jgi:hypothetical protein
MRYSLALIALAAAVQASPFAFPQGITAAIPPKGSAPPGCQPSYAAGTFGIAVLNISTAAKPKRQVSTIADGQPQAPTVPAVSTISDGQPQAPKSSAAPVTTIADGQPQAPKSSAAPVTTIADGQPQAPKSSAAPVTTIADGQPQAPKSSAAPVSTIADGQPQAPKSSAAPVSTIADGQPQAPKSTAAPVTTIADGQPQAPQGTACAASQIVDGQPQACTSSIRIATMGHVSQITDGQIQGGYHSMTMMPVSQISDGQPQGPTVTYMPVTVISDGQPQAPVLPTKTECAASQIVDGQPQACTSKATANPVTTISDNQPQAPTSQAASGVSQLSEGQPQAPTASASAPAGSGNPYQLVACKTDSTLSISLNNGILTDSVGRTGYIAANYQFQFDKPPQAGAIYTSGFSMCGNGSLALGGSNVFWQCLSGNFYNLYDRNWAAQCSPVTIESLTLINC